MTVVEFGRACQQAMDACGRLLARVPEDKLDWRPVETVMTLGELCHHVATACTPVVEIALTGQSPYGDMPGGALPTATPAEARALLASQQELLTTLLAEVDEDRWMHEQGRLPWGTEGSLALRCHDALDHTGGHRYQLFLYLKLLGQELNTMHLYGLET